MKSIWTAGLLFVLALTSLVCQKEKSPGPQVQPSSVENPVELTSPQGKLTMGEDGINEIKLGTPISVDRLKQAFPSYECRKEKTLNELEEEQVSYIVSKGGREVFIVVEQEGKVQEIWVMDPTVVSPSGIKVGDSFDSLKQKGEILPAGGSIHSDNQENVYFILKNQKKINYQFVKEMDAKPEPLASAKVQLISIRTPLTEKNE